MGKTWFELDIPVRFANCSYDNWRSFIFDMPEGSRYAGYTFAHPRKLTRRACGAYTITLHDQWAFNLMRQAAPGKLDEESPTVELSVAELIDEFLRAEKAQGTSAGDESGAAAGGEVVGDERAAAGSGEKPDAAGGDALVETIGTPRRSGLPADTRARRTAVGK